MTDDQIRNTFTYHAPTASQVARYQNLRDKAMELGLMINRYCPESREKSIALTKLQEAVQMANAAIAITDAQQIL